MKALQDMYGGGKYSLSLRQFIVKAQRGEEEHTKGVRRQFG